MSADDRKLRYHNTDTAPAVGDRVKFVEDTDILSVEELIDTPEKMARWGVDEFGLMLAGGVYGRVFDTLTDDELVFLYRGEEAGS